MTERTLHVRSHFTVLSNKYIFNIISAVVATAIDIFWDHFLRCFFFRSFIHFVYKCVLMLNRNKYRNYLTRVEL